MHVDDMLTEVHHDIVIGTASGLLTKEEVDAIFGIGNWCIVPRFILEQGDDRWRCIENGSAGWQNEESSSPEQLRLPSVTFPGQVSVLLCEVADEFGCRSCCRRAQDGDGKGRLARRLQAHAHITRRAKVLCGGFQGPAR